MNLDNIDEKLERIAELFFLAEKAQKRSAIIAHDLDILHDELAIRKKVMDKEHQDVVKLEKMSKFLLFLNILKDREQELEKERQEYLQAVLDYNAIAHEIDLLSYEKELLVHKSINRDELKKQRDYYLKIKEQKILFHNSDHAGAIKKLNKEIESASLMQREIKEAVQAVDEMEKMIEKSMHFLSLIDDNFGLYEFSKKYLLTFSNKKYLDKAIDYAIRVKVQIKKLDKELGDVYEKYELPSLYKYEDFMKDFHSNLISDWVLKNKLDNAMSALKKGMDTINRLQNRLEEDRLKTNTDKKTLIEEKRMYVLNS